jgi:hypothetical protein
MVTQLLRPHRIGIAVASAVGLVMSCYFAPEADGAVSKPPRSTDAAILHSGVTIGDEQRALGPGSLLLASLFSEKGSHVDDLCSSCVKAFAFGTALWASVAAARRGAPPPTALRAVYGLSTLVCPVISRRGPERRLRAREDYFIASWPTSAVRPSFVRGDGPGARRWCPC